MEPGYVEQRVVSRRDVSQLPTGTLIHELIQQSQLLLRDEIRVAKAEAREEVRKATRGAAELGVGAVFLHTAFLALVAFLIGLGSTFMAWWSAALIAAVILGAVGGISLWLGRQSVTSVRPAEPLEQMKEDGRWAKQTLQSARSSRHAHA